MAVNQLGVHLWSVNAGADLTGKLFYFASLNTSGQIIVSPDDGTVIGVIVEEAVANKPATVQLTGIGKVVLGATLNAGVLVEAKSDGTAEAYTTGPSAGVLLAGGNSGEIVPILLNRGG